MVISVVYVRLQVCMSENIAPTQAWLGCSGGRGRECIVFGVGDGGGGRHRG